MNRKLASMLSLCQKAGKLCTGEVACEKALQGGLAQIVIVCNDASDNTKKKFSQKTHFYEVPYFNLFTKDELSAVIGRENRATLAIIDKGFADKIMQLIDLEDTTNTQKSNEPYPEVDICPN